VGGKFDGSPAEKDGSDGEVPPDVGWDNLKESTNWKLAAMMSKF